MVNLIYASTDNDTQIIEEDITHDFVKAVEWSKPNKMRVHFGKTTCMLLGTKKRLNMSQKINIKIENTCIKNVSEQKLLGIHIDENLSWSNHLDHLCSLIDSKISLLRQLSDYVPTEVQKLFYQGYILPYIDYGSITWVQLQAFILNVCQNCKSAQPALYCMPSLILLLLRCFNSSDGFRSRIG